MKTFYITRRKPFRNPGSSHFCDINGRRVVYNPNFYDEVRDTQVVEIDAENLEEAVTWLVFKEDCYAYSHFNWKKGVYNGEDYMVTALEDADYFITVSEKNLGLFFPELKHYYYEKEVPLEFPQ